MISVKRGANNDKWEKFHMRKTSEFAALAFPGRELCRFRCEVKAYQALQKHGVCERGHVPRFYDSFTELDPTRFSPHLDAFLNDEIYPSAILLEYLPNAQQLHCVNYSEERMKRAVAGIRDIHSAHVEHNDASPKHILIVLEGEGNLERIVWIDLDVSTVYSVAGNENSDLKVREERRLRFEVECVESLGRLLVSLSFPLSGFYL